MKKIYLFFIFLVTLFFLAACSNNSQNSDNNSTNQNIDVTRTSTSENNSTNENTQNAENSTVTQTQDAQNETPQENSAPTPSTQATPEEKTLYEFSTQIKSKSSNRLNNIQITCSTLNETVVEQGKEFSFCKTIGKSTEEKGYKKADVIINKEITKALGGGNCQVSSTLYNAILGIPDLKVTERHPHGKAVNYVPEGKDAAVSYGSKDLKFINNTAHSIKIYATSDKSSVNVKIVSLQ